MKSLLTWAVLSLAIMAGFTARAATGPYVIELMNKNPKKTWVLCKPISDVKDKDRLGDDSYVSYETCIASADYKRFVRVWETNNKKRKKNPLLENLGPKVLSVESTPTTDKEIHKYVKYFESKTGKKIDSNKIFFGKIKSPTVGLCYMYQELIIIDKTWWKSSVSAYSKEELLYHELGHCYFKREHNDEVKLDLKSSKSKCPNSMMNSKAFGAFDAYFCFHLNRDYYFTELKTKAKKFHVNIRIEKWTDKSKWEKVAMHKDVIPSFKFDTAGYKCELTRFGLSKTDKYGYRTENFMVSCSKDSINYIYLFHSGKMNPSGNSYRRGYSRKSRYSSELWVNDPLTKELFSISLALEVN